MESSRHASPRGGSAGSGKRQVILLAALAIGFPAAIVAPSAHRLLGRGSGWCFALVPLDLEADAEITMLVALLRLLLGPSLPDRVVTLDLFGALGLRVIAAATVASGEPVLLRSGIALALISFLGTAAFASWVERRGRRWSTPSFPPSFCSRGRPTAGKPG
jgi:multicomponent Na+:H+ antiporter subunit F